MADADLAYLSILQWPETLTHERRVEVLMEATGLDAYTADLRVARGAPAVVHRFDASRVREVLTPLAKAGVKAAAPTQSLLATVPPVVLAKSLARPEGAPEPMFMAECWRHEAVGFLARDVFLLVRARLRRMERGEVQVDTEFHPARAGGALGGIGFYGGIGTGIPNVSTSVVHNDKSSISEVMDVYMKDNRRLRFSGEKFNFDVLGKERDLTGLQNMDKLALLIAESSPAILIDTGFDQFTCPSMLIAGWHTVRAGSSIRNDTPAFDFYSAWVYLLRRRQTARER